jgi:hypothetical protein
MGWQYTKRPDGNIALTLDNNVWNFLFDRRFNLASELPSAEFIISIPREVEIEKEAIPVNASKSPLRDYIARTIAECGIKTDWVFGFATEGAGPQRSGGFDQGTWQGKTEQEFYEAIRQRRVKVERLAALFALLARTAEQSSTWMPSMVVGRR